MVVQEILIIDNPPAVNESDVLMMKEIPLDWFVDPITKEKLIIENGSLFSSQGRYIKERMGNYWNFMPQNPDILKGRRWKIWNKIQRNGMASYKNDPYNNLALGERTDCMQFSKFCDLSGNVLDVGVGPQRCPAHIGYYRQRGIFFIGIDPLIGEQPRDLAFVRGLGEYLPFKQGLFDCVLFVTSLDHFLDPRLPLKEAGRVLKAGGSIYIWLGEKRKGAPDKETSPRWYKNLKLPNGADDFFHFKRLNAVCAQACFAGLDLDIKDKQEHRVDNWRKNIFYRLTYERKK